MKRIVKASVAKTLLLIKGTELLKHMSTSKMVFYHTQILDIYQDFKKKKLNPSNYFISWVTFQTIYISNNSSLIDSILPFKNALENRV